MVTDASLGTVLCLIYLKYINQILNDYSPKLVSGNYYKYLKYDDEDFHIK